MARLTFPITTDGLCVDVRANLDGATIRSLLAAERPVPTSIQAIGLLDTGTDMTAIADVNRLERLTDRLLDVTTWQELLDTP